MIYIMFDICYNQGNSGTMCSLADNGTIPSKIADSDNIFLEPTI